MKPPSGPVQLVDYRSAKGVASCMSAGSLLLGVGLGGLIWGAPIWIAGLLVGAGAVLTLIMFVTLIMGPRAAGDTFVGERP